MNRIENQILAESQKHCRFCGEQVTRSVIDLGLSPLCEEFVPPEKANFPEYFYPLHAIVCDHCFLVQVDEYVTPDDIYTEYAYFSSYSDSWVEHARRYVEQICEHANLQQQSFVVELASNDGYLLQHFLKKDIPVLGVEPAANVADVARSKGIPTVTRFFGAKAAEEIAREYRKADLIVGNNVLAHVPDLNDFVAGIAILLRQNGLTTMEFPHLLRLLEQNQYDTIYHEHFSYFSLSTVSRVFAAHRLQLFHVEEIPTHGGSVRVYVRHAGDGGGSISDDVGRILEEEKRFGVSDPATYENFRHRVEKSKRDLLTLLFHAKESGKSVVGYGAPGKGNTLLNYCGIRQDLLKYTVDRNEYKHGRFTPGTRIPIYAPNKIRRTRPDLLLVLPWNLFDEIREQTSYIREWGGKWIVPIPDVKVVE